jgi:hypothetical protein
MEMNQDKTQVEVKVRSILSFHKGKANAVSRWQLVEQVFGREAAANRSNNNPFDRQIRIVIEKYRDIDFICSSSGQAGYWIAESMEDVEIIIQDYENRSRTMEEKARNLRKRGIETFGPQIALPL